jgi:hypothetical protein
MKIIYQEYTTSMVIDYFIKGFTKKPKDCEVFFDPVKNKFIFKLYIQQKEGER